MQRSFKICFVFFLFCGFSVVNSNDNRIPSQTGFHATLFWDRGFGLDDSDFSVFNHLDFTIESNKGLNEEKQKQLITGNQYDQNGILLYPDNSPRYQIIFSPGGDSRNHGRFLTHKGRENIRSFFKNGGSYVGICGGAALVALSREENEIWPEYYQLWPGYLKQLRQGTLLPTLIFEKDSQLSSYLKSGKDQIFKAVEFRYGSYPVNKNGSLPKGTRVEMRFDLKGSLLDSEISCWSYKPSPTSGLMVAINSHPEIHQKGNQLELTKALFLYALDGVGLPKIKGVLRKGKMRQMNQSTDKRKPVFARIGDSQIHYFLIELQNEVKDFTITLHRNPPIDFRIFLSSELKSSANKHLFSGSYTKEKEIIVFGKIPKGKWYLGVQCLASVKGSLNELDYLKKNTKSLNGIKYNIKIDWREYNR